MDPKVKVQYDDGRDFQLPDNVRIVHIGTGANDVKLSKDLYARATAENKTFSHILEEIDPSVRTPDGKVVGLDAYERQLQRFGIITRACPEEGIYASRGERFFQPNNPTSAVLFPEFINRIARMAKLEPAIVDQIVGVTRPITGDTFKSLRITWEAENVKKKRTVQGTEFPQVELTWADEALSVKKYGRSIKASYEFVRRVSLDLLATTIMLVMQQSRVSEADDAVAIARSGMASGYQYNANGTASGLDKGSATGATPRNCTYKAWLRFALKFYPYKVNTLIAGEDALIQFLTMTKPGADPFELLAAVKEGPTTINLRLGQDIWGPVNVLYNTTVPQWKLLGLQKEYALERVVEIGADMAETQRLINAQFEEIVVSECQNFGKIYPQVIRELTLN